MKQFLLSCILGISISFRLFIFHEKYCCKNYARLNLIRNNIVNRSTLNIEFEISSNTFATHLNCKILKAFQFCKSFFRDAIVDKTMSNMIMKYYNKYQSAKFVVLQVLNRKIVRKMSRMGCSS